MTTKLFSRRFALGAAAAALVLAGCSSGDPLGSDNAGGDGDTIVVGSQAYYSNEIIAEIYAQALEAEGLEVERRFNIGQRDAYLPSLENGEISVFPEYTGNLLEFYQPDTTATTADAVYAALKDAVPDGLTVLDQSPATDQDSYNVTKAFADQHQLTSIADLAKVDGLKLGGAPELAERPYGPDGLKSEYGVTVDFEPTGDTTIDELIEGRIQIANVYSADPRIQTDDLVTLDDPKGLFLASHVVPVVNSKIADRVSDVINRVSAAMTPQELIELNVESTEGQRSSADIAKDWIAKNLK